MPLSPCGGWGTEPEEEATETPPPQEPACTVARAPEATFGSRGAARAKVTLRGPPYHLPLQGCSRERRGPQATSCPAGSPPGADSQPPMLRGQDPRVGAVRGSRRSSRFPGTERRQGRDTPHVLGSNGKAENSSFYHQG